ncbi:type III secretion chaperone SycN [Pandoraea terrigena]|uniref:Secretion system apparatus n=1 Tax=Pandoraea terrigena TaxID=2508292 RepID=A0A5E4YHV4_9BURK|nr:type III secretion chaperone SycN [Pandoraea terrigena]VVE47633.1 secretion system apparatus [Pandoraea terrigena]
MDTQTQRKLEQLFELLALPPQRVEPRMQISLAPCLLMIEVEPHGATLVLTLIDRAAHAPRCLPLLLQTCAPEWSLGIPVRACVAQGRPMLIATPPAGGRSQAVDWFACLARMRRLLERLDARQWHEARP